MAGFFHVRIDQPSEVPPPLVGATLTCVEVPINAHGRMKNADGDTSDANSLAQIGPQYGLVLFGGDNEENHQTDTLMVFYVQERKWRRPTIRSRAPSKRSRHTASVVCRQKHNELLLIFGGVGATNAIGLLDLPNAQWSHPPACSKAGEKERARRRAQKTKGDENASDSLLPCARFGHSAAVFQQHVFVFGGADFRGTLGARFCLWLRQFPHASVPALAPGNLPRRSLKKDTYWKRR